MAVPADLLEIIVCPGCHGDLVPGTAPEGAPSAGEEELVCTGCGNAYPVRDEIPVLLLDEARRPTR